MIRALALASLLAACSYDATLGVRPTANSNGQADAAPAVADASTLPDVPANLAFDYGSVGGPIITDGSDAYTVRTGLGNQTPEGLIRADLANTGMNPIDVAYVPITAMAQDATTIYALSPTGSNGLYDLVTITKAPVPSAPPDGNIDAASPIFATATLVHDLPDASAIAVDASSIFVVERGGSDGKLLRMDKTGANPTTLLATAGLSAVVVDGSFAYVVEHAPQGRLLAVPKAGGTALVLAATLVEPLAIDLAGGEVYITEQGDASTGGAIGEIAAPAAGAQQADVAAFARIVTAAHTPVDLAHDATYLYWTADRDGLMRAPLAGGTPELRMGTAAAGNAAVAIDGDYVLFASPSDNGGCMEHAVLR
jgi:hypothetical protein